MGTRREVLRSITGGALAVLVGCDRHAVRTTPRSDDDALDYALRKLQAQEPSARGGLSSHATMVAETLCTLGAPERAVARVERDRDELIQLPPPREPIAPARWRDALGRTSTSTAWERSVGRFGDWTILFEAELRESSWQSVLQRWLPRLLPGAAAAATHGAIRTAHAVRALERHTTPERVAELARGLAYWAAAYQELPALRVSSPVAKSYADALRHVPRWADTHDEPPRGNIVAGLDAVSTLEGFEQAIGLVSPPSDPDDGFARVVACGASLHLRHATAGHAIAFVHAVTGPCALWRLSPWLPDELTAEAIARAWQLVAAIYAAYAREGEVGPDDRIEPRSKDELVEAAMADGDDHIIKLTDALLWSHAMRPDPVFLTACAHAVR